MGITSKLLVVGGIAIVSLGVTACGAPSEADTGESVEGAQANAASGLLPPPAAPGEGHAVAALQLGAPGTVYNLTPQGGSGGTPISLRGAIIYAIQADSGSYVDRVALGYYIPSHPDNLYRQGDTYGTLGPAGGGGGTYHDWAYCPTNEGAIGIQGSSGIYVDRLGLICSNVTSPNSNNETTLPVYGGTGGSYFYDDCGTGYLMDGVNIRSGVYVDQIQGICIKSQ